MNLRSKWLMTAGVGLGLLAIRQLRRQPATDLNGKLVLITGGSRGLGLQLAREFGSYGAVVIILARDAQELESAQADLIGRTVQCHTAVCDVSDQHKVEAKIRELEGRLGPIDILVNNAGLIEVGPLSVMEVQDFEKAMSVIFWGTLYTTLAVLPSMRQREQGQIVNITSIGAKVSVPHLLPYACAKFAAQAFSEGLCSELAGSGIRVTTIVPGLMRTGSHLKAQFKGQHGKEYAWFGSGAATPFVSIGADRAARSIVQATRRADSQKILSMPAELLADMHGIMPGVTSSLMGVVARLLPTASDDEVCPVRSGAELESEFNSAIWKALTAPGRRAAESLNQLHPARA